MNAPKDPAQDRLKFKGRPRLILHIGSQKTGTTTIQGFLKNSAPQLSELGVHYVKAGRTNIAHNSVLQHINKGNGAEVATAMLDEIISHPDQCCVISSEMFFRREIAHFFARYFPMELRRHTTVLAYVRRQDKYAEAMYKQRVKNGRFRGSPADYAHAVVNLNYGSILGPFARAFGLGNVLVRPFERKHFPGGDVLRDFASIAALPDEIIASYETPSANASLSREVSEKLGDLKRSGSDVNTRDVIRYLMANKPAGAVRSGDCYALRERREMMKQHRIANEALCATYRPDLAALFDTSDLSDDTAYAVPTAEEQETRETQARAAIVDAVNALSNQ